MAIVSFGSLVRGRSLSPVGEAERVNPIKEARRLYYGDVSPLGIKKDDNTFSPNWFKRVSSFYPEYMFSEKPEITVNGNERFTRFINDLSRPLLRQLFIGNKDIIRYGEGILCSHPFFTTTMVRYEPDLHFEVINPQLGIVEQDIIGNITSISDPRNDRLDRVIQFIIYNIDGTGRMSTYKYDALNIGENIMNVELPERGIGRQVVSMSLSEDKKSWFQDMVPGLRELYNVLSSLSLTIDRNSRPHLYGPDGAVAVDDQTGKASINTQGMYFPLQPDDKPPGYLQWDSNIEAIKFQTTNAMDNMMNLVGLNRILFNPDRIGEISGSALRRVALPFVSRVNILKEINTNALHEIINIININNQASGGELYSYSPSDIEVEWKFNDTMDENPMTQGEGNAAGQEASE